MDRVGFDNILPTLLLFGAVVPVSYSIYLILADRDRHGGRCQFGLHESGKIGE